VVDAPAVVQGDAFGLGLLDLEVVGGHLVTAFQTYLVYGGGAQPASSPGRVDGDVAAPHHEHLLALQFYALAQFDRPQELESGGNPLLVFSENPQANGAVGAGGKQHRVPPVLEQPAGIADLRPGLDSDANRREVGDVVVDHLVGKPVGRDTQAKHAPGLGGRLKDLDAVALAGELPGGGQTGRSRADHGYFAAIPFGQLGIAWSFLAVSPVGDEALQLPDG